MKRTNKLGYCGFRRVQKQYLVALRGKKHKLSSWNSEIAQYGGKLFHAVRNAADNKGRRVLDSAEIKTLTLGAQSFSLPLVIVTTESLCGVKVAALLALIAALVAGNNGDNWPQVADPWQKQIRHGSGGPFRLSASITLVFINFD